MIVYEDECRAQGVDPKKVRSIAMRLERAARDAQKLGLLVFGGAHSGSIRGDDDPKRSMGRLILADVSGSWDGGDGGACPAEDGLMRGERP